MEILDSVIIGAGQAGLGTSYYLQTEERKHLVLERGRVGESWLSQRWDSFQLNTLNFMNTLPGLPYDGPEPNGFWRAGDLVAYFQRYISHFHLPVHTGVTVTGVEQVEGKDFFRLQTRDEHGLEESVLCRSVVVASGVQNKAKVPPLHTRLPASVTRLHAADYRNPGELPPGAVLIVGSGQSGCQIAEDLLSAGREVYLSTGKAPRVPRRYRGRDILEWMLEIGFWDVTYESLPDKSVTRTGQPQISGVGESGHSLSLQSLARQGAVILGSLKEVDGDVLLLAEDAPDHVRFADGFSQKFKNDVDAYLQRTGMTLPRLEDDPADLPDPQAACASPLNRLDLRQGRIGTVIWSTGFTGDFGWLKLPALDEAGLPIHNAGISTVCGLYFIGFPWLTRRKSGIIHGITEDARLLARAVSRQLG